MDRIQAHATARSEDQVETADRASTETGRHLRAFECLAQEAWVNWNALVLLGKLALLGGLVLLWLALVKETGGELRVDGLRTLLTLACGTTVVVLALVATPRVWRGVAAISLVLCAASAGAWLLNASLLWPVVAPPMLAGMAAGVVMFLLLKQAYRPLEASGALSGALPMLGTAPGEPPYRDEVETWLARFDGSFARGLTSTRIIVMGGMLLLIGLFACRDSGRPVPRDAFSFGGYALIGFCAGVVVGLALLPARARSAMAGAVLPCVAALTGVAIRHGSYPGPFGLTTPLLLAAMLGAGAIAGAVVTRFLGGWSLARLLPAPLQRHLLGSVEHGTASRVAQRICENCRYDLEGLPEAVCDACDVACVRCPECGHAQPAATRLAGTVLRLMRWFRPWQVLGTLVGMAVMGVCCLAAFVFGANALANANAASNALGKPLWLAWSSLWLIVPVRLALLRMPWGGVLSVILPAIAMVAGAKLLGRHPQWGAILIVATVWTCVALVTPLLAAGLLQFIYGAAAGREMFAVLKMRPLVHGDAPKALLREGWAVGRGLGGGAADVLMPCQTCGTARAMVGRCSVSATDARFHSMLLRARAFRAGVVALIAVAGALLFTGLLAAEMQKIAQLIVVHRSAPSATLLALFGLLLGAWLRLTLMRRPLLEVMGVVTIWFVACMPIALELMRAGYMRTVPVGTTQVLPLMWMLAGAAAALPLLRVAAYLLCGKQAGRELLDWAGVRSFL